MDQLQHPDTVRRMQPMLHLAAEQHRFVQEHIDGSSANAGSRAAKERLYEIELERLTKAIARVVAFQELLRENCHAAVEAAQDKAIQELVNA